MTADAKIEISIHGAISEIGQLEWDACAGALEGRPKDPFTTYRFLSALEASGSVGKGTGWSPRHLAARADGQIIAVMPCYAKGHSQGEYIFDHNWAHAFENAGGQYYPKLQASVPFTPATGRRFLTKPGFDEVGQAALVQGAVQLADQNELSSFHLTFCTEEEFQSGGQMGLSQRIGQQFHWYNQDYANFDAFLAELSSRKRKNLRKERDRAKQFGGQILGFTGDQIQPEHWDAFWRFYQDTGMRKWGTPYLTREFFYCAQESLRDDIYLVLAENEGRFVAGAMNFIGADCLYGRYWGCVEDHPCLHFEICYYQAIDYAIEHGLARVEAGAQGAHKLARGYLPAPTYSLHWIADAGFREAIERYLEAERDAVGEEIDVITDYGPFRKNLEEDNAREVE